MKKKLVKKLTLNRETLRALTDLQLVIGGVDTERTVCATGCATNCPIVCNSGRPVCQ